MVFSPLPPPKKKRIIPTAVQITIEKAPLKSQNQPLNDLKWQEISPYNKLETQTFHSRVREHTPKDPPRYIPLNIAHITALRVFYRHFITIGYHARIYINTLIHY